MRTPRRYSELECFTLGLVWQLGPCSAYDVRRHMQRSPSTEWSGSAGAIYPLMQRLHKRGLLAAHAERNGKRRRCEYTATPKGVAVLKEWIGPPLAPEAITVVYDPLRSRARFLAVMSPAERRAWLDAAADALAEVSRRVEDWKSLYAAGGDPFTAAVNRHGEMDVQWRRHWLDELRRAIAGDPAS
jgi:DNA-binding PadR family transcriptional regulator